MKLNRTTLALASCLIILILIGASEVIKKNNLSTDSLLAAAKKAVSTSKTAATLVKKATNLPNVFARGRESYLSLTSPFFNFISLLPSTMPITALQSTPALLNPNDVLTVTNPQSYSPITNIEHSLVNIFCSQKIGNLRKVITGSGVLIKDNLVLTDAHVAVYPLAADSNTSINCLVRTGSPATATHSVKVVFISPEWVQQNGPHIAGSYTETGENDYALLKITPLGSNAKQIAANALTPLHLENTVPNFGSPIKAAAYPANVLGNKGVDAALTSQTEQLTVRDLINFNGSQGSPSATDLVETSASNIGQQGSSGGIIADENNNVIGLISNIVGSSNAVGTFIRGLTLTGINNSFERYSSGGLSKLVLFGTDNLSASFDQLYRASLTSIVSRALSI